MAEISLGDVTGTAEIKVDDSSLAGKSELSSLISGTTKFIGELDQGIDTAPLQSVTLGAKFNSPSIAIDSKRSLTVKANANSVLTRYTAKDSPLLGSDPSVPEIPIGSSEYWMSFELDATLDIAGTQSAGSGFGVGIEGATTTKLSTYTLFSGGFEPLPTVREAIAATLNSFQPLVSSADVRNQKPGSVSVCEIAGTVTVSGSYSFPFNVNQLVLAEALVPFKVAVQPSLGLTVGGSVALTGDFSVRSWRKSATELVFGLFKKHGTTFTASFSASAGVAANQGNTDLIQSFFKAVAPEIDLAKAGLDATGLQSNDPRFKAITTVLHESISTAFEISVNGSAAATFGDEAAVVYSIDLSGDQASTNAAIDAALGGDWSKLGQLSNAKELKNVVGETKENRVTFSVHLLGIFNYESVDDFVKSSTVLHNREDGSVTITDTATATRIAVASEPYRADPDKLRRVLYEACIATAAYTAAGGNRNARIQLKQSLLSYQDSTNPAGLRKELRLAVAIGELTSAQWSALQITNPKPAHVVIDANQTITGDQAVNMFFSDPVARTPRALDDLKNLGRQTLASLLDPLDTVDQARIQVLNSPAMWADMDHNNKFPSQASYADWYDVSSGRTLYMMPRVPSRGFWRPGTVCRQALIRPRIPTLRQLAKNWITLWEKLRMTRMRLLSMVGRSRSLTPCWVVIPGQA